MRALIREIDIQIGRAGTEYDSQKLSAKPCSLSMDLALKKKAYLMAAKDLVCLAAGSPTWVATLEDKCNGDMDSYFFETEGEARAYAYKEGRRYPCLGRWRVEKVYKGIQ